MPQHPRIAPHVWQVAPPHIALVDTAYESEAVKKAYLRALPFDDGRFDVVLLLDVLAHVELLDQLKALSEVARVLKDDGVLLMSVPNLAHLHSRLKLLFTGKLMRTSAVHRHPGDRPRAEYEELLHAAGFRIESRRGIFPTLPLAFRLVNRHPQSWGLARRRARCGIAFSGVVVLGGDPGKKGHCGGLIRKTA